MATSASTLRLTVTASGPQPRIHLATSPGGELNEAVAPYVLALSPHELATARALAGQNLTDHAEARRLGAALFRSLISGPVAALYDRVCDSAAVPPRVVVHDPDNQAAAIPWELAFDDRRRRLLAPHGCLLRTADPDSVPAALVEAPLTLLHLRVAHPEPAAAAAPIPWSLADLRGRLRNVVVTERQAHTADEVAAALRGARSSDGSSPDIVHITASARPGGALDEGALLLPGGVSVSAPQLVAMLGGGWPRLVVVDVGTPHPATDVELLHALCRELLRAGAGAASCGVVTRWHDRLRYWSTCYKAIAAGSPLDSALASGLGRRLGSRRTAPGLRVTYARDPGGRVLAVAGSTQGAVRSPRTATAWRRVFAAGGALGWIVGLASGLAGLPGDVADLRREPGMMTGRLRVAVAAVHVEDAPAGIGRDLGRQLAADLQEQMPRAAVWGPDQLERRASVTDSVDAERVAQRVGADVVVYGTADPAPARTVSSVYFYLSGRRIGAGGAPELVGTHDLGPELAVRGDLTSSPGALDEYGAELQRRLDLLVAVLDGLDHYATRDWGQAANGYRRAIYNWPDDGSKPTLRLLLGNAEGRRGRFWAARRQYRLGLAIDPDHTRLKLGSAELRYHEARADCSPGRASVVDLNEVVDEYDSIEVTATGDAAVVQTALVRFGRGRALLCLSEARAGVHWREAEDELQTVTTLYDDGHEIVEELAAESHALLGRMLTVEGGPDASRYRRAACEYMEAARLAADPDRSELFQQRALDLAEMQAEAPAGRSGTARCPSTFG